MSSRSTTFAVGLYGIPIGRLTGDEQWWLEFDPEYVERYPRPVLGQWFEDRDLRKARQSRGLLPYFRNLLPERSALRTVVALSNGFSTEDELELIACLGADLPGASTVTTTVAHPHPERAILEEQRTVAPAFRFSLAGIQPKMSVRLSDDYRTVLPVSGEDGQWILKLPNAEYPKLVEREYGTMCWARDSGFEVPEVRLIDAGSVMDVPSALKMGDGPCYLIRRYDRVEEGGRIHQEDFAQVLDHQPADKYGCTIVRLSQVVLRVMGRAQHERFLDRLVFDIMAGNGDAHLKNWSIVYPDPDGRVPTLAPCYDIVPTILYPKLDPSPGLKFPGSPRFSAIDSMCFKKLLRQTPTLPEHTWDRLARVATRIADAWSTRSRDYLEERDADVLSRHMEQVPVVREWLGLTAK